MTLFNLKSKLRQKSLAGGIATAALMATTYPALADIAVEQQTIEVAPASDSKRVYVTDPGHFQMTSQVGLMQQ